MVKTKPIKYRTPLKSTPFEMNIVENLQGLEQLNFLAEQVFVKVFQSMYTASSYNNFFYDFFSAKLRPIKYSPTMGVSKLKFTWLDYSDNTFVASY